MSTLQDLEQEVLRCWEVTQDLKLLAEVVNDGTDHTDTVNGIIEVYELRFDKAWKTYEYLVDEYYKLRKRTETRDVNFDEEPEDGEL